MPKTSIYLTEDDLDYLDKINSNTSAAIRYCIGLLRNREHFKAELREILGSLPQRTGFKDAGVQAKILKLMEE